MSCGRKSSEVRSFRNKTKVLSESLNLLDKMNSNGHKNTNNSRYDTQKTSINWVHVKSLSPCTVPIWFHHGHLYTNNQYCDVKMGAIPSQITSLTIVYSTVYSDADQRKHQSSAALAFVRGIHRGPVNFLHKWPVTRKIFPFGDVIMR